MKKNLLVVTGAVLCFASTLAIAECTFPKAPDATPDGKTATQPDMIAAMAAFKQYNADVEAYVTCLDEETAAKIKEAGGTGAIMQIKAIQSKKKNSALDERAAKIEVFNKEVREFKARG